VKPFWHSLRRQYYQYREAASLAFSSLWSHKMRALLTVLGVVIGVTTVIAMVSIIDGLNQSFANQMGFLGADTFFIQKYKAVQFGPRLEEPREDFEEADAEAIARRCPAVAVADFYTEIVGRATFGNRKTALLAIGSTQTEKFDEIFSWWVEDGRMLTQADIDADRYVAVVGSAVAEALAPEGRIIGERIKVNGHRFQVVGVFGHKGEIFGVSMDNYVVIPHGAGRKAFGEPEDEFDVGSSAITVRAKSPELVNTAIDQAEVVMRERRRVPPEAENDFEIYTADSLMDIYNQITGAAFAVMIGISAVSLLVGGIGIMNIMLVSVTERTREIGVRKALGARQRDILAQFIAEATVISVTGGVLGIVLGVLIGEGVSFLTKALADAGAPVPHLPAAIKAWSVALGFMFSLGVGLFFGIFPANKAAKLNPIEALRYE
jgi:putative ABC transport system permease protein